MKPIGVPTRPVAAALALAVLAAAASGLLRHAAPGSAAWLVAGAAACGLLGAALARLWLPGRHDAVPTPAAVTAGLAPGAAVERMRAQLDEATANRNYLDAVLNSMTDAVLVTTPEGRIREVNAAAKQLFGGDGTLLGREIEALLAPEERRRFELARAVEETREFVMQAHAGGRVPVSLSGSRIDASGADAGIEGCIFVARDVTERKRAERRIRHLARYDSLTRLPNRMQFQHLLQQAIARARRGGTPLALLYLDLDRFKDVNDTFGHAAGDRTLEILSERLTRLMPNGAVVGRLAGDEFAVLVEGLPGEGGARGALAALARELQDGVSRAFYLNDTEIYLTLSIGIALCPDDAGDPIDLIRNADAAMYHCKQGGGGGYVFYAPAMQVAAVERLILKSKLRRALERDEFVLMYQPKIDLATGRLAGAEALLRWRLPGHGDIAPGEFIPLAEQTSLIQPIGEWVLRRVCRDYRAWQAAVADPGRVSINLSLRQLQQASFITRFASVFREYGVAPDRLELEITETTLMANAPRTLGMLDELNQLGIRLSIDDFGTGYSSLSTLAQLPVDTLKIDQSFVRRAGLDRDDSTLVRTVIEMGRNLDMEVVAEGVETEQQFQFLRERGCHYAQGRLFGEPMDATAFQALLEAQQRGQNPVAVAARPTARC